LAGAAKVIEAVYSYPIKAHATMEPMNATARYTPDRCEVWCPTQNGDRRWLRWPRPTGLSVDKCEVYKQLLGGGFGRAASTIIARQAVGQIGDADAGTPVKLLWSREEDMTHDF